MHARTNPGTTPGNSTATHEITTIVEIVRRRESTATQRNHWRNHLVDVLPDPPEHWAPRAAKDAAAFLELCEHLAEHSRSDGELQELVLALVQAEQDVSWSDPFLDTLDGVTSRVIDRLYDSLAAQFETSRDREQAQKLYERLRDHCFGCDERIIRLAAISPHITGRRIVLDFDESVIESTPAALVRKLEKEGEHGFLLSIIGYGTSEPGIFLGYLTDPDRLVELAVTHAADGGYGLPLWLWESDVLHPRFELLRRIVPWCEIEENADRALWARIEEHLQERFGENRETWETFRALEPGFPGTLDELVDAAKLL